jgi:hypothetical protein
MQADTFGIKIKVSLRFFIETLIIFLLKQKMRAISCRLQEFSCCVYIYVYVYIYNGSQVAQSL